MKSTDILENSTVLSSLHSGQRNCQSHQCGKHSVSLQTQKTQDAHLLKMIHTVDKHAFAKSCAVQATAHWLFHSFSSHCTSVEITNPYLHCLFPFPSISSTISQVRLNSRALLTWKKWTGVHLYEQLSLRLWVPIELNLV